ncbi:MAG: hypothetical protein ACREJ2_02055 [Planctomycetota bacterium]
MNQTQSRDLREALRAVPILDPHSHLVGGHLGAQGLHDILLYHMSVSDLYGAGCPSGKRLTEYPGWPTQAEAHARLTEALPFLKQVKNTSIQWGVRTILRDLYGVEQPVDETNWRAIDGKIRERAQDAGWHREILHRQNIQAGCTELARRENGEGDDFLHYCLEWTFFARTQWGEFDTALYELERAWKSQPKSPLPIGGKNRPPAPNTIRTVDEVKEAVRYVGSVIPYDKVVSVATHLGAEIDYTPPSDAEMQRAIDNRQNATLRERDLYAAYIHELFLAELEKRADRITFQFATAAEPMPFETCSRIPQATFAHIGRMVERHPKLKFQCFLSSHHGNQTMCSMCRELPNLSMAGIWWHNFFPNIMRQVLEDRLDMLPMNRQIAFFSDAYCVEWSYAKAVLVREVLADALIARVERGQYSREDAIEVARGVLFDSPQSLLKMTPRFTATQETAHAAR